MFEYHIGPWLKVTLEVIATSTVLGALTAVLPPLTAAIGLVYWSIMLYRLLTEDKKDK